jgi:hypothetical protein
MKDPQSSRSKLIVNRQLIRDFLATPAPCCTLGLLEERSAPCAFFALRPRPSIRSGNVRSAFSHGHALLGAHQCEVLQFGFTFFEFSTYHVLVNPNNPVVHTVLNRILDRRCYFIFAINPNNHITAFRADLTGDHLARLTEYQRRTRRSTTTDAQYQETLSQFRLRPSPPGQVLEWVCCDNVEYLDLSQDRLDVFPAH